MSCFVVSHLHINSIVSHASRLPDFRATFNGHRQGLAGLEQEVAQLLLDANCTAWCARYGQQDQPEKITYTSTAPLAGGDLAALKLVDCLAYQLENLDAPEQNEAWQLLQSLRARLLSDHLSTQPAYTQAPWELV